MGYFFQAWYYTCLTSEATKAPKKKSRFQLGFGLSKVRCTVQATGEILHKGLRSTRIGFVCYWNVNFVWKPFLLLLPTKALKISYVGMRSPYFAKFRFPFPLYSARLPSSSCFEADLEEIDSSILVLCLEVRFSLRSVTNSMSIRYSAELLSLAQSKYISTSSDDVIVCGVLLSRWFLHFKVNSFPRAEPLALFDFYCFYMQGVAWAGISFCLVAFPFAAGL